MYKNLISPGQQICVSSPSSPAADGLDYMPQDLVLLLDSMIHKSFLSEIFWPKDFYLARQMIFVVLLYSD